jgi:CRISPR-associated endonuclease/helicase Cas3
MNGKNAGNNPGPSGLLLPGLDGANPLGFLAALGLFRIVCTLDQHRASRMSWVVSGGTWVPLLQTPSKVTLDLHLFVDMIVKTLAPSIDSHSAQLLGELGDDGITRRVRIEREVASGDRDRMDWVAALASDSAAPESINQLQTARRDYFYGNITSVIDRTTPEHLRRALFLPWDYADALDNQSLHLDPSEDRRHAYQWNKPAGDPDRKYYGGMLGANRLALEAIPLFTSLPEDGSLRTIGFTGNRSTNTRWTWPIWSVAISLPVARSLLTLSLLQAESISESDAQALRERGVSAAYRTRRILVGKTPNFTPAKRVA